MTKPKRLLVLAVLLTLTAGHFPSALRAGEPEREPDSEGLGPCQDAPFAAPGRHPRLQEHKVDGVRVLVLRPEGYDPRRRYPVLYLLHGGLSVPDEWVTRMDIGNLTVDREVLVVMPDGGRAGYYRDWASGGRSWETFHTQRLVPWVDANFPTIADRSHRAIAGLSMGGGGAMYYAARHPDLFGSAGSFSGAPLAFINTADHTFLAAFVHDVQQRCEQDQTGVELFGVYGNPVTDETAVRDNMPEDLALGLTKSLIYVSAGDGIPADDEQRDLIATHPDYAVIEPLLRNQAETFTSTLVEHNIGHVYDRVRGSHWWATFRPGLARFVDLIFERGFGVPAPGHFDYRTARDRFSMWGWDVIITGRSRRSFTTIRQASAAGFTIGGDGETTVTTAASFRPHERVLVTVADRTSEVRADRGGRITVSTVAQADGVVVKFHRRKA